MSKTAQSARKNRSSRRSSARTAHRPGSLDKAFDAAQRLAKTPTTPLQRAARELCELDPQLDVAELRVVDGPLPPLALLLTTAQGTGRIVLIDDPRTFFIKEYGANGDGNVARPLASPPVEGAAYWLAFRYGGDRKPVPLDGPASLSHVATTANTIHDMNGGDGVTFAEVVQVHGPEVGRVFTADELEAFARRSVDWQLALLADDKDTLRKVRAAEVDYASNRRAACAVAKAVRGGDQMLGVQIVRIDEDGTENVLQPYMPQEAADEYLATWNRPTAGKRSYRVEGRPVRVPKVDAAKGGAA
jgi:hypothetical protein